MFSCIGRGPYFYQGKAGDVSLVRKRFPDLPLIGAYGAGEIAPLGATDFQQSRLISYSSVISLAYADV
jgi:small ligand-binding sensory domain FIST